MIEIELSTLIAFGYALGIVFIAFVIGVLVNTYWEIRRNA